MAKYIGTWVYSTHAGYGDSVKTFRLFIGDDAGTPWGQAVSTDWTPTLEVRKPDDDVLMATITGSWTDGAGGLTGFADFTLGTASALVPASGSQAYEALVVLTKTGHASVGAADNQAEPYTFTVKRWP